jgi:phosphoglycerate kinase
MKLPALEKANVSGKTVFLRADLDVPLETQNSKLKTQNFIEDDTRLKAGLPTIEYLLKNGAKVIIAGHLGRPEGIDKSLSLEPVTHWLNCHPEFILQQAQDGELAESISGSRSSGDEMPKSIRQAQDPEFTEGLVRHDMIKTKLGDFDGWELSDNLFLLENLRFYKGEEDNDWGFAKKLASLADIYINDAFAVCHRAHASIVSVPKYLPHFAGLHLQEEVRVLSGVLENPNRPLVLIIGGAKIETKLPLVEKMRDFADYVLVGGKIVKEITPLLKSNPKATNKKGTLLIAYLNQDGFDITKENVDEFLKIINTAGTIVWNGPVGYVEIKEGTYGSRKLAEGIVKSKAYTIVGGGDTLGFLKHLGLLDKFSFASTGGGAMLEFLSGKKLPGIIAILS